MSGDRAQLSQQAREALARNDIARVNAIARNLIAAAPFYSDGHYLLARVALAQRQFPKAAKSFNECIKLDQNRSDAIAELAQLRLQIGQHGESFALLKRHRDVLLATPRAAFSAAELLTRLGMHELAFEFYQVANDLQPNVESIEAGLAAAATKNGELELAITLYEKLLAANPANQRNHFELSRLRKAESNAHIEIMLDQISQADPQLNQIFMHFAIAKEYEDLEDWDASFTHYSAGAESAARESATAGYSVEQDIAALDACRDVFNSSWLSDNPNGGPQTGLVDARRTPIFVMGLPRTGTTLVERILASHSLVCSADETFFMQSAVARHAARAKPDLQSALGSNLADVLTTASALPAKSVMDDYLKAVEYRLTEEPYFVDKYPFNFHYLGIIAKAMPSAKVVLLERDPMDACVAMFRQPYFKYSYRLQDLADYYLAYRKLVDHWKSLLPGLVVVKYENLINVTKPEIDRLLTELGLELDPQCYRFFENRSASATASSVQIREKIHSRSLGKWRKWEKQLSLLASRLESNHI